ncbi:GNAT family N-acetyltransferase [Nonomuraea sp. NPDC050383]|uniref:GNAT family N-acetyltransferase n=1 Tax=Nonomuraea sp. NPDC050383 TaxID=3364362 RepID=UPI0037A9717D
MSALKVRQATPQDAALLAGMNPHVHGLHADNRPDLFQARPSAEELTKRFAERLGQESTRIFVAEPADGECAGYAEATVYHRGPSVLLNADSFIALNQIVVAPEAKRLGVATALLDAVREAGREAGCRRLVTEVWEFNEGARSFYEAAGLQPMKRLLEQPL